MGVRLYPKTEDETLLEKLAGVPEGTHRALRDFESLWDAKAEHETVDGYDRHCALSEATDLHTLHNFLLFGWGRVNMVHCGGSCYGEATGDKARTILKHQQSVDIDVIDMVVESGGVWWG